MAPRRQLRRRRPVPRSRTGGACLARGRRIGRTVGLRQSEALALQWKDIDLLANTLTVRRSIHRVRGGLIYEGPFDERAADPS